jgi:cell division protein FtsB
MDIIFKILRYLKKNSNLIKSVIIIALVTICVVETVIIFGYKSLYKEEVKSGSTMQTELDTLKQENEDLKSDASTYNFYMEDKDKQIIQLEEENEKLKAELSKLKSTQSFTTNSNTTFKADGNYDQATKVWNHLRNLGLNEYVCAGILGNIMAEVGGQSLDISRWPQYSQKNYYGICQWSGGRKQRLLNDFGTTLEDQIRFLSVELFEVIPKGNSFYNMQDEKEAALYFAKYYERCSSKYYSVRQTNATKALEYFT